MTSSDSDHIVNPQGGATGSASDLRLADELLRQIVGDAPELIVAFDLQRRFLSINRAYARAFAEVFGRPVAVGETIDQALAHVPAEQANARALWDRALGGEEFTVERSFGTESGESHLFELTYRPLRGADGRVVGGSIIGRDIAERRAAELALVNRNEELSQSQRIAGIGTWKWIVGEPAMRWSMQTFRMLSRDLSRGVPSLDELAGLFEPDSYTRLRRALDKAADDGNPFEIDLTAVLPYGQRRQFTLRSEALRTVDGHVKALRGTIQDITERWRAEEALRRSVDRWRFAIESTGDGVWDWNIADGHVYVSPRWKEMLGHDADDPVGSGFEDWRSRIHADDEPRVMHALLSHLSGATESYQAEYRLRARDGSMRWILDRGRVIERDSSGRPMRMISTHTDVSARRQAEEALARSRADYQLVVENQNELVCRWTPDTTLTFVNDAYCRHFGMRADRLVGTRFLELVPAAERYAVERMIERILAEKQPASYEHAAVTPQGEVRWHLWKDTPLLDDHGQVRELLSVGIDITDRKRVEEALRASEARFAAFMDNCPAAAWTTDRDGLITYANSTYQRLFAVGNPTGQRRQDLYPPHLAARYEALDQQVLREGKTVETIEEGYRRDGTPGQFLVYKFPTQGNDGRAVVGGMALDITEREATARELRVTLAVREVLAKASSQLINLPAGEIDGLMATVLEQLGRLMEADRAWMFRYERDTGLADNTIEWCAEGIRPEIANMQRVPMSTMPWLMSHLAVRRPLAIDSLEVIPASEVALRQLLEAQDIKSVLLIPVHTGAGLEAYIGFDSVRRARVWKESETQALEMIANLSAQVIERQRVQQMLGRQLEALSLLVSTSSQLIAATPQSALEVIGQTLERLGRLFDVDRAWLFRIDDDGVSVTNTVEWCAPGIDRFIDQLQQYPLAELAWFHDRLKRRETIVLDRVADMPPEAAAERAHLECQSIQSCLIVPVVSSAGPTGFLGFDSVRRERTWSQAEIQALELLANIYAQVLQRAAVEAEQFASEELLRQVMDNLPDPVLVLDVEQTAEPLRILFVNRAIRETHGYEPEELLGRPLVEVLDTEESARLAPERLARIRAGEQLHFEVTHRRRDGSHVLLEVRTLRMPWHGQSAVLAIYRDITERRQAERALRENEQRLRESQRVARIGSWTFEVDTGRVIWSEELYHLLGMDPGQPAPSLSEYDRIMEAGPLNVLRECVQRAITLGESYHVDLPMIRADGRKFWTSVNGIPFRDVHGRVVQLRGTVQDIDQRKRAEVERERLQAELVQAQKMEAVGRLAGGVAHDFNNMLTVILGHVAMALNQVPPESPLHADLCAMRDAAQRSSNLTRQLLAFARKQRVAPQVLDLNATIEGMLRMLRRLIGEGIELEWQPGADLWRVCMDPSQVDQVLANLMANARDALRGIGRVVITTANVSIGAPEAARTPDAVAGDFVRLTVMDNGPGMDESTRANLFEPFFTTKEPGEGTGLGLATVYGTVRQVGGFITVQSAPGVGTTFAIHLPRTDDPLPAPATKETSAPAVGRETILVAEDEAAILKLTCRILSRAGYSVLAANNPQEAYELAARHGGPIDLLITDVVMPAMSGSQLKAAVRKLRPDLRTLYVSGYSANDIAPEESEAPDFHYLQKPFTVEGLLRTVREVLDGPG